MRKIVTTVACCILVSISSTASRAQTRDASKQEESLKQADEALNAAFQRLLAKISPDRQTALRKAETTWVSFRDQECEFEALGSKGGSVHSLAIMACRERVTRTRTGELLALVNCPEGDVACGHQ
ncbi:lysozyme inhibitor LprI family protein [Bradyrhizobium sp. Ai1a-2]|uniref:lysozyme inhibitor LprI family protein n=1 Tax=Bradyrhizobium sp. Ai1a-2 TaxID=196490 RepID=UPI000687DAA7|nr:lysozyme inhibitor LprI family protein [Bradyrhizobium sp. Ai1a-2]